MHRLFLFLGSFSAFLAIAAGAFGAHFLKKHLVSDMLTVFETAVRYQMYHALGLCLVAIIIKTNTEKLGMIAGWSFVIGTLLFSGSLYILSLSGIRGFGAITPFGGLAFLVGWFCLALLSIKSFS